MPAPSLVASRTLEEFKGRLESVSQTGKDSKAVPLGMERP